MRTWRSGTAWEPKSISTDFGRIAAQTAKQVIIQKVKDAERENIFEDFKDRKGEVISGTVQRFERGAIIVNLGRAEAVIPQQELVPRETYKPGDRIRAYVLDVRKTPKGPQIILSRSNPNFLIKLFEMEVPEVSEGIVKIISAAREPGSRAKIAVYSRGFGRGSGGGLRGDEGVPRAVRGPGAAGRKDRYHSLERGCRPVLSATPWLRRRSPRLLSTRIRDPWKSSWRMTSLSLAIGRRGQNVRLAAKLTDWKIDIRSEAKTEKVVPQLDDIASRGMEQVDKISGVGEKTAQLLNAAGYLTVADLCQAAAEQLIQNRGDRSEEGGETD